MRIIRLRLQRFRGFTDTTIVTAGHVALVGEPRAGRSDVVGALRRVLDPRSTLARVNPLDVNRQPGGAAPDERLTEVEVTLVALGSALEQLLDGRLQLFAPDTGETATSADAQTAVLGLRLCYRARYDEETGTGDHWVDFPHLSDPANGSFARVPRVEREALPFVALDRMNPLQLRADGVLRRLITDDDPAGLQTALDTLRTDIASATVALSATATVRAAIAKVLDTGAAQLLELTEPHPENKVSFVTEDGSTAALLRAVQPALDLDAAGALPLVAHGSTATGILAIAEALVSASAPEAVLVTDDFGDDLDGTAAEYLAGRLRRGAGQVWLSTRRPEAIRAFRPEELLRLTRSHGQRQQHQLPATTDRKKRAVRRQLELLLLPAMTARTVVLLEGPHDLDGYTAVADRRLRVSGVPPPAGFGMRLVAAPGPTGGKDTLPALAQLARDLGFNVRVVVDNDGPGTDIALLATLEGLAEAVVRLPNNTAVERALVAGLPPASVRPTLTWLAQEYALGLDVTALSDAELEKAAVKAIKSKSGLHQPWVDALPTGSAPPMAIAILESVTGPAPAPPLPKRVDISDC